MGGDSPIQSISLHKTQPERRVDHVKTGNGDSVVVRKGESLEDIMMRVYRKKDMKILDAILKINSEIKNPNLIHENQVIRLPHKTDRN
jgi:nucleoid-associated protein YgaU